jgi:hypothetical protein
MADDLARAAQAADIWGFFIPLLYKILPDAAS